MSLTVYYILVAVSFREVSRGCLRLDTSQINKTDFFLQMLETVWPFLIASLLFIASRLRFVDEDISVVTGMLN